MDNVQFHVGAFDAEPLPFADGSVDVLCAYSILHLVDDAETALGRMFRLLRPGGFFVSSTVCLGDTWVPYVPMLTVMRWLGKAPPVQVLRSARLQEMMARVGFADIQAPEVGAKPTIAFLTARRPS